jgi:hypothetical protein
VDEINNFITVNMVPSKNKCDVDHEESVYFGISKAIEHFNPRPEQSNFIVLIGDAGNHNRTNIKSSCSQFNGKPDFTNVKYSALSKQLIDKNINLVSIQANHKTGVNQAAYDSFRVQSSTMINELIGTVFENYTKYNDTVFYEKVVVSPSLSGKRTKPTTGFSHYQFLPSAGGSLSVSDMQKAIETVAEKVSRNYICQVGVDYVYDILCDFISRQCNCVCSNLNIRDQLQIRKTAHWITMSLCALNNEEITNVPDQLVTIGYTKADLWQYDLYTSKSDLGFIKRSIESLIPTDDAGLTENEYRSQLLRNWKNILMEKGIPESTIDGLSLEECSCILTGYSGNKFSNYQLNDIVNSDKFNSIELYSYLVDWLFTKGYIQSFWDGSFLLNRDFFENHYWTILNEYKCRLTNDTDCEEMDNALIDIVVNEAARYRYAWDCNCGVAGKYRFCPSMRIPIGQETGHVYFWMDTRIFPHASIGRIDPDRVNQSYRNFSNR